MGRNNKWIESGPDDTVRRVAQRALKSRLKRTWHYLERAVRKSTDDDEDVHQLRIFARRAAAAMDIFAEWLPQKRGAWMDKQLKRIRQAAGEARDFDVLALRWSQYVKGHPGSPSSLLLEHIKQKRREAQRPIEIVFEKLVRKKFGTRTHGLVRRIHKLAGQGVCDGQFACVAHGALRRLAIPYLTSAQAERNDAEGLHAFRIQGKQVRYAMEIFAGAFPENFREHLYPVVVTLQERLGAINDHVTAQAHFAQWLAQTDSCALRDAIVLGIGEEQKGFDDSLREFLDWWTPERRADLSRSFGQYLQLESLVEPPSRRDERAG